MTAVEINCLLESPTEFRSTTCQPEDLRPPFFAVPGSFSSTSATTSGVGGAGALMNAGRVGGDAALMNAGRADGVGALINVGSGGGDVFMNVGLTGVPLTLWYV